ncbi:MAG: tRNA threonylcarbamoyladenosine dehydratase [Lachnospiraceae bacterium]|nr:tRNA threonylcarbamoyladenosine dehydratase [Candidatus Merdinaster equi]
MLIGPEGVDILSRSRVAVFGIGGVGGYVCEALVRSGVGEFDLIDSDKIVISNINRQIIATHKTVGMYKTQAMLERMKDINPDVKVNVRNCFFLPENENEFAFEEYDYVVDAVDTVSAKIALVMKCNEAGVPIISAMGAGNKLEASSFKVADIYKTNVCPLAKVMRRELKKRGIKKLKVVYSEEMPIKPGECKEETSTSTRRSTPGSIAFVPSVAGLIIAGEVVKDLIWSSIK